MTEENEKLYEALMNAYRKERIGHPALARLFEEARNSGGSYEQAYKVAQRISRYVTSAGVSLDWGFGASDPYDAIRKFLTDTGFSDVADYAAMVQESLNKQNKIGLKVQTADLDVDKVSGLAHNITHPDENTMNVSNAIENFCMSVVDSAIKNNARFQKSAGLSARITRIPEWKCCEWCSGLGGSYEYDDAPEDIFKRHENCRCTMTYSGKKLSAYKNKQGVANTFRAV